MNKTIKWLVGLVAALLVINIGLVATIWVKKDQAGKQLPMRGDARDYLVNSLSLTDNQVKNFDNLRQEHFQKIREYQTTMRFLKDKLFGLLNEKDTTVVKTQINNYLQQKIGETQAKIDIETFNHFYQLRSTLSEQQKQKFDSTIQQVLRTMAPRGGAMPPPPGEGSREGRPDRMGPPGEGPPPPDDVSPHS